MRFYHAVLLLLLPLLGPMTTDNSLNDKSARVDALFQEYDGANVPGASVLVVKEGRVIFKKAYGMANLEERIPSTTKTNYRLASVTKQFTAMSIMILAERKKLSYDSTLRDFFPGFPEYGKRITVRHLLNHTSGLIDYEEVIPKETSTPLRDKDVLQLLRQQESTYFAPGSAYRYSNSGYALLALIVEAASGSSFARFLEENIFRPLGMSDSVAYEQGISTVSNRAYGYRKRSGGFERKDQSLTSSVLGDGGIYSSVEDLYKWDRALYTNRLVSFRTLRQAFTQGTLTEDEKIGYGFGWYLETYRGLRATWHYGSTVGFRTAIERFPERRLTVVVLVNREEVDAHKLARQIADLYLFDGK